MTRGDHCSENLPNLSARLIGTYLLIRFAGTSEDSSEEKRVSLYPCARPRATRQIDSGTTTYAPSSPHNVGARPRYSSIVKLSPQPHSPVTFGLRNTNEALS